MRDAPDGYAQQLARIQIRRTTEVTSWLGSQFLGVVPVKAGQLHIDATAAIPGTVTLTVPTTAETRPGHPGHMLAAAGQQIVIRRSMVSGTGEPLGWFEHGRYRLLPARAARGVMQIRAVSLEKIVELARFTAPTAFSASTYRDTLRALMRGLLPVEVAADVPDRSSPSRLWERERLEAVQELVAAWGMEGFVGDDGTYRVRRLPTSTTPTLTLTDGWGGTVQDVTPASDTNEVVANGFVASSVPDNGSLPISETAILTSGPRRWGGPYGVVPKFLSSNLMTTRQHLRDAAKNGLAREQLKTAQWTVTCISDDRIERGDVIRVIQTKQGTNMVGRVTGYTIPLTIQDEPGTVTISAISGVAYGQTVGEL